MDDLDLLLDQLEKRQAERAAAKRDAQIRGNLNAMRRAYGRPEASGPSLPPQQWWLDDLVERGLRP